MSRPVLGYLAGAAFALCATTALAQAAAPAPAPAASDHEHGQRIERRAIVRGGDEGRHHMDPAEHLRTMLQLKPSQEAALSAYLLAVKPDHRHETVVEMSDHGDAPKTTTQRLAEMETRLNEQAAQGKARIEATRKFYAQLEPSQKKVFDEMPMAMIGPMGPMMPMGGHMRVMINTDGVGEGHIHDLMARMPPMPPVPPMPPRPPHVVFPPNQAAPAAPKS